MATDGHPIPPLVSVIIPCRNEAGHIESCLRSVLSQEVPDGDFEVIVADGMSDDGTRPILECFESVNPRIRVVDNPARIVSAGMNRAIGFARGRIIIRMDAHSTYADDYICACVTTLQETGADNVGGAARTRAFGYVQRAIAAAYHSPFAVGGARFHDENYEGNLDTVTYGCWPRETFSKFGLFDEDLVRNQDDAHNLSITRGGGRIWQSARIRSWYSPRSSVASLFRQYWQYGYWKVLVIRKHRLPASFRHLVPGAFVLGLALCMLTAPFSVVARLLGLTAIIPYTLGLVVASLNTAAKTDWRLVPVLPVVFIAYHFGYGMGFLKGILDFFILKRRVGRSSATALTRSA